MLNEVGRLANYITVKEKQNYSFKIKQRLSRHAILAAASNFYLKQLFNLYSTINFNQMKQRILYKHYDIITTHFAF